jgi:hypothetical protein
MHPIADDSKTGRFLALTKSCYRRDDFEALKGGWYVNQESSEEAGSSELSGFYCDTAYGSIWVMPMYVVVVVCGD